MHKLLLTIGALLTSAVIFTGCMTVGKTQFPEATAGFTPKQTYAVSQDTAWNAIQAALERNRIIVATQDKASGTIQTDYIEGASRLIGMGLVAAQSTRYKFALTVRPTNDGQTKLVILCKIESTMKGSSGSSPWTDVSGQNPEGVKALETWLYEEIEEDLN